MGAGFKVWSPGDVLTASDVNNYLMEQSVMSFADAAARTSAIGTANFEEGMLSYLQDTDKIQVYNGTAWTDAANNTGAGLVHIETQTIGSGVSSISFNNVFSLAFRRYKVVFEWVNGSADIGRIRLRFEESDNSAGVYDSQTFSSSSTTNTGTFNSNATSFPISISGINARSELTIWNPFSEITTHFLGQTGTGSGSLHFHAGPHKANTSFDGFTFFLATQTFTSGYISVYGIRD